MNRRPDIVAYSPDKKLVLVAEVKNRRRASPEWVTQMRQNLLAQSIIPDTQYFLLALPDFFYLWKNTESANYDVAPNYKIDAQQVLGSYINQTSLSLNDISEQGLELLITSWLRDLANSDLSKESASPALQWLFDSGLYDAIKNGSVLMEAAA